MTLRITSRAAVLAAACLTTVLALGAPAFAHTEVSLDPAQAGAVGVAMKVKSEAESDSAGIASVQIFLPAGIAPAQVSLAAGPDGWTVQAGADNVTVSGPALTKKTDAEFTLKLAQLPATESSLTFKTLVTYTDGKVDRWIGPPGSDNPAPVVALAPAATTATSAPPARTLPSDVATASSPDAPAPSSSNSALWWIIGAIVVVLALAALLYARRRRGSQPV